MECLQAIDLSLNEEPCVPTQSFYVKNLTKTLVDIRGNNVYLTFLMQLSKSLILINYMVYFEIIKNLVIRNQSY
jgi:hypothetical protein